MKKLSNARQEQLKILLGAEKIGEKEAFEIYYVLGEKRSIPKLYQVLQGRVSKFKLNSWQRRYYWCERAELRDIRIHRKVFQLTERNIIKEKLKLIDIIHNTIDGSIIDSNGQKILMTPIQDISDFEKLVRLYLVLIGEPTEIHKITHETVDTIVTKIVMTIEKYIDDAEIVGMIAADLRSQIDSKEKQIDADYEEVVNT